ncbi:MAG: hypothetical protein JXR96_28375, partial [Deltaproteobacteria bacterium]|nr:hypothetical protein [Deltaproteobacteria bacterium]
VCLEDECSADADCDDGLACNGQESCAGGECQDGRMIVCPEHAACTEPAGDCVCDPGYEQVGDACVAELPIAGLWHDLYGTDHEVSQASWSQTTAGSPETDSLFHIHRVEAEARFLVAQNDADNPWNPELWSRFDWTWHQGALYYCQIAYDAASEEAAAAAAGADPSDPEHGGCGAFAWSRLNPTLEIIGDYTDNYGGGHEISQLVWFQFTDGYPEYDSFFHISFVDSEAQSLVAQNDADNGFNPELWSRFDWTFVDGVLWYCQTIYDAASEAAARAASPADPSDPASGGCGGYAWSRLDPI